MRSTTLFILLYLFSCRTNDKEVTTTFVDGEQPPVKIEMDGSEREVPGFMWSPSQRKATAGFQFLVAEYVSLTGDVAKASEFYKSSYNLDPNPFLAAKLIRSHASTGQLDDALPEAKKMVLLYPKSSELRLLHGQLLARKGVYYPAVKELEKSLEIGPPSELAYKELIALHLSSGLSNRAVVVAEDYTKAFSNSADAWAKLSQIYFTANEPKKALIPAQRAYELQSLNPEYTLLFAIVSEMNGDRKKAVALYEQLYRLDPGNEELIGRMIALYKNLGDLKDALDLLNELSKLTDEANPGVDIQRAFVLWELKRFKEASEILEGLANKFPEAERLQYMKALGYEKTGRVEEAAKIYSSITDKSSFYVESQFRLMISYNSQGKKAEAEAIFDRMKENEGVTWEFYVIGASIKSEMDKNKEAAKNLEEGYKKFPDQVRLLFLAGVYYEKNKEVEASIKIMRQVIKDDKSYSAAYNFLGYLYAESGTNLEEAENLVKKALELKPDDGYYLDSLGWIYFQKKQYQLAKKTLEKALDKVPDEGVIMEHLSDVYLKLGDNKKSFEFLERASKSKLEERDKSRIDEKYRNMKEQGNIN